MTFETLIAQFESLMREIVSNAESSARATFQEGDLPIYDVIRYHLGWVDQSFAPERADSGKRIRPMICLLTTGAAGGRPEQAMPVAVAIELLHNFTLLHDDIQDRSTYRRGRPTVWSNWGEAQAINAGDATFAISQLALLKLIDRHVAADLVAEMLTAFNEMTLRIVEGQVLDLGFENRWGISATDYLRMIEGKTAAIVAFAAWAGAKLGNQEDLATSYHEFGRMIGLGFQIRDDYLGIWGSREATGKTPGDDIHGRKKSIPILMLMDRAGRAETEWVRQVYESSQVSDSEFDQLMTLLDTYQIDQAVQSMTTEYHDRALELLTEAMPPSEYRMALYHLAEQLVDRSR